ncbi:MAG: response regulator [Planctomycetes bacterium]|nr:response regulator [Planctomycetota bacterium]
MTHRVLVVDESDALTRIVSDLLARNGFEVVTVAGADQALELLRQQEIDVVISDVALRGTDGFAFARRIRADASLSGVPIVYLTARTSMEDEFQGWLSGADAWLAMPFRARELLDTLRRVLHGPVESGSSGRLAVVRDGGRVIAAVTGPRVRLVRAACRRALCELELVPRLDTAMSRADREKFDLLVCESLPAGDVQGQVSEFLGRFGLALPVLFLLEHTRPLPDDSGRRHAVRLPATVEELAAAIAAAVGRAGRP